MIVLEGCRAEPLGSYLQGLGTWRAVCRTPSGDAEARAHWQAGRLVLTSRLTAEDIVDVLRDHFAPLPLVSPWNAGSGFAGNGKNAEAERALATVRASTDPRLADLREAVAAADRVVDHGRAVGWAGKGDELWDKARKADVVRLARNLLPDAALAWLDATVVLGRDETGAEALSYSRLLGTGGNLGRLDLQSAYVQRALTVLLDPKTARYREGWLRAALFADEGTPYLRESVGQFDPGRAGGIQSSPREKSDDKGFANPWSFLLTVEGALLFASAAARRLGARTSSASVPFVVRGSAVGFGSSAVDEQPSGEVWAPQWERPATLAEVRHLFGEGRVEWNGRPAQSGLDFVRAIAALGVDRGVRRFKRHVVVERLGQSPLAVPVDTVDVDAQERGGVQLLRQLDDWLSRLRRDEHSSAVAAAVRRVDAAMYEMGRSGGGPALRTVLVALGRLHEVVARSPRARDAVRRPLELRDAATWWRGLGDAPAEWRIAAALASGGEGSASWPVLGVRRQLSPVTVDARGLLQWTGQPARISTAGGVVDAVAELHRRRARPGALEDPAALSAGERAPAAVRGTFSAFRHGREVSLADVISLATLEIDPHTLADALAGLVLLDWRRAGSAEAPAERTLPLPPLLALLLPFYSGSPQPYVLQLREDDTAPVPVVLRPDHTWPGLLAAGSFQPVVRDATARLRAAGFREVIRPPEHQDVDGPALAAALLLRVPTTRRYDAVGRVIVLPRPSAGHRGSDRELEGVPA